MNCGSSAGIIENPARPRISAAHMAATTGAEGAAVADRARVTVPNITIKRRNTAESALIDCRVGQRQHTLEHSLVGIPRIVIPMDVVWLGIARLPRWGEAAGIQ